MKTKYRWIILIILLIISIPIITMVFSDRTSNKNEYAFKELENADMIIKLDLNNEDLLEYIQIIGAISKNPNFYKEKVININELELEKKIGIVLNILGLTDKINEDEIHKKYSNIFNDNYEKLDTLEINNKTYKYNEQNNEYELIETKENNNDSKIVYKIIDAYNIRNDNKNIIEFTEAIGFGKSTEDGIEYYKDPEYKELVGIYDETVIDDETDKFDKYSFTFNLIEEKYYLSKIEKITN